MGRNLKCLSNLLEKYGCNRVYYPWKLLYMILYYYKTTNIMICIFILVELLYRSAVTKFRPLFEPSHRNFESKMVPLDAERSNLSEYMYFCIKRSFAACPGGRKSTKIWRELQHKICIIAPNFLCTYQNGNFILLK